jgi:hypothetical protein
LPGVAIPHYKRLNGRVGYTTATQQWRLYLKNGAVGEKLAQSCQQSCALAH